MKEKYCVICKSMIKEEIEQWVRLTDFNGKIQNGEVYYHLECWRERFQITNSERKKKMYSQVMKSIKNIKDNLGKGGLTISQ